MNVPIANAVIALAVKKLALPIGIAGIASGVVSGSLSAQPSLAASAPVEIVAPAQTATVQPSEAPTPEPIDLFERYFGKEAGIARAIAKAENRTGDPAAVHINNDRGSLPDTPWKRYFPKGSEDYGLMQVNLFWNWERIPGTTKRVKADWLIDPEHNIQIAKQIRDDWANFTAWSTYNDRTYQQFLERN
jgi:hypothetical protein